MWEISPKNAACTSDIWLLSWFVALFTLVISMIMLIICTIVTVSNSSIVDFWKQIFTMSFTAVVTIPMAKFKLSNNSD